MLKLATIPVKYLVLATGYYYGHHLLEEPLLSCFTDFCTKLNVSPLFITMGNEGKITAEEVFDECCNDDILATYNELHDNINATKLVKFPGAIVFQVNTFDKASEVFTEIGNVKFCEIYGLESIKFLQNNDEIEMVIVQMNAESG